MLEHVQHEIWQKSTDLLVPVYTVTNKFPQDELQIQMNQLRASAVGIVVHMTEALSCDSDLDLQKFWNSSIQAAQDCIAGLQVAKRLEICPPKEVEDLMARADEIVRMLTGIVGANKPAKT